jgi:hypothetical protein
MEEVAAGWRRLHSEELHKLHPSPNILRVIQSRRDEKYIQNSGRKNLKIRDHSVDLGVDGNIISEWILGKQGWKLSIGFHKGGEFLD